MDYRRLWISGLAVALAAMLVGAGAFGISRLQAAVVEAGVDMQHEVLYPCGKTETVYAGPMPEELVGMDIDAIQEQYAPVDGWAVSYDPETGLVITQHTDELCPEHADYRHLGTFDGFVAVYEGPLGRDERVVQIEQIPVENLTAAYRQKLEQAMDFEAQTPETQAQLRGELEFDTEDALHSALENLDELKD